MNEQDECVGTIVGKLEMTKAARLRGYIAMLAIRDDWRRKGLATRLITEIIEKMKSEGADEVILETEVQNEAARRLYIRLGFVKSKLLHRYYLNGHDAHRLKLWLTPPGNKKIEVKRDMLDEEDKDGVIHEDNYGSGLYSDSD
jgi:ribosomal protein S18 acetylase RimI-like enzyme